MRHIFLANIVESFAINFFCYFYFVESFVPHYTPGTKRYKTWLEHSWRLHPKFVHLSFLSPSVSSFIQMPKQLHPRSPSCITSHHLFFLLAEAHRHQKMNSFTSSRVSAPRLRCVSKSNTMHARVSRFSHSTSQPCSQMTSHLGCLHGKYENRHRDAQTRLPPSRTCPEQALWWSLTSSLHLPGVSFHAALLCFPDCVFVEISLTLNVRLPASISPPLSVLFKARTHALKQIFALAHFFFPEGGKKIILLFELIQSRKSYRDKSLTEHLGTRKLEWQREGGERSVQIL